jgi:hypothetical protein
MSREKTTEIEFDGLCGEIVWHILVLQRDYGFFVIEQGLYRLGGFSQIFLNINHRGSSGISGVKWA